MSPRSPGWGEQRGSASPQHLVPAPACKRLGRSWTTSTRSAWCPPAALEMLHMGFFGGRLGNTASFILFSISKGLNAEHCAERSFPLHLQSPFPVGPAVELGVPGLAVSKSHGGNDPCSAMLSHLAALSSLGRKAEVLFRSTGYFPMLKIELQHCHSL